MKRHFSCNLQQFVILFEKKGKAFKKILTTNCCYGLSQHIQLPDVGGMWILARVKKYGASIHSISSDARLSSAGFVDVIRTVTCRTAVRCYVCARKATFWQNVPVQYIMILPLVSCVRFMRRTDTRRSRLYHSIIMRCGGHIASSCKTACYRAGTLTDVHKLK